jgi:hypothetical protein
VRVRATRFSQGYHTHDIGVSLPLRIPAMGYTTLTLRPGEKGKPTRHPETPRIAVTDHAMENEFLAVAIESNGTLTVRDGEIGLRAGAGIVADSIPEAELAETRAKANGILRALGERR